MNNINGNSDKTNHINDTNRNHLLAALPENEYERIQPFLEFIKLPRGKFIYHPEQVIDHVYFPTSGIISVTGNTEEGKIVEIGLIGREGMAGIDVILGVESTPYESMVQIQGEGFRVKAGIIKDEFHRCGELQARVLRYTHAFMVHSSQLAVCNRVHTVEQRLASWMLKCYARAESEYLPLTQEFLAQMLGANRPTVSECASKLQEQGLINYRRGRIEIINHQELENVACDCYRIIKSEYDPLLKSSKRS